MAEHTEVRVCLDLMPAAADNSLVNISVILLKFSFAGMYRDTKEVPLLNTKIAS
jgi:hypothetical protein